jgi:hypothetical protein
MTIIERTQRAADINGRRKALTVEQAQRVVALVVDECLAVVEPFVLNAYGGDVLLRRLRALRNNDSQKEHS